MPGGLLGRGAAVEGYPKLAAVGGEEKGIVPRAVYSSACAKQRTGKLLPFALVGEVVLFDNRL